jgi:predicted metalloprotease
VRPAAPVAVLAVLLGAASAVAPVLPVGAASSNDVARSAIADVQSFWETAMPKAYGQDYVAIPDDHLHAYDSSHPAPACGGTGTTPYKQVAGNAFYCPEGNFVAWDDQALIPKLQRKFGDLAVALVFAHEFGHVVQGQTNTSSSATIPLELQADCFAGAWTRHATTTTGDALTVKPRDLDQALSGYLYFRDPVGTSPGQQGAHGSAFDRISAFNDGYGSGVTRCKNYETNPPEVTEIPFTSSSDLANQGNLPFSELVPDVRKDLDSYWKSVLGRTPATRLVADQVKAKKCGATAERPVVTCADGTVAYAPAWLRVAYSKYGDYAAATLMAEAWADAAARKGDVRPADAPSHRSAECMAGAWAGDLVNGTRQTSSTLSPGDLDEAVSALLAYPGRATAGNDGFVRFRAFRTGFANGARRCGLRSRS